jgi:hypothetical protein
MEEINMKIATITLIALASTGAGIAFAQDGSGHGPPKKLLGAPAPTGSSTSITTNSLSKLFQPKLDLLSATK